VVDGNTIEALGYQIHERTLKAAPRTAAQQPSAQTGAPKRAGGSN
jgi:hypothetical protein